MNSRSSRGLVGLVFALALLVVVTAAQTGCRRDERKSAAAGEGQTSASPQPGAATPVDLTQLNGEIERLEKQAERNPADEETQDELARAYVKRAKVEHGNRRFREALTDFQRALRYDPDNEEAQAGAATVNQELGGNTQEDENGAPAPPPISPNVADEDGKPTPTATPKKQ